MTEITMLKRRESLRLVKESNVKINVIRGSSGETMQHYLAKTKLCEILQTFKKWYITEARFKTGGRADILNLDDLTVYEVLMTETEAQFKEKLKYYPKGLKIIGFKATDVLKPTFSLLPNWGFDVAYSPVKTHKEGDVTVIDEAEFHEFSIVRKV